MSDSDAVRTTANNNFDGIIATLRIFGKNVQSLKSDTREDELLAELECFEWDMLFLSETWRSQKKERKMEDKRRAHLLWLRRHRWKQRSRTALKQKME